MVRFLYTQWWGSVDEHSFMTDLFEASPFSRGVLKFHHCVYNIKCCFYPAHIQWIFSVWKLLSLMSSRRFSFTKIYLFIYLFATVCFFLKHFWVRCWIFWTIPLLSYLPGDSCLFVFLFLASGRFSWLFILLCDILSQQPYCQLAHVFSCSLIVLFLSSCLFSDYLLPWLEDFFLSSLLFSKLSSFPLGSDYLLF